MECILSPLLICATTSTQKPTRRTTSQLCINRNLSSSVPILNDAPDIGRSNRFQTMGLLVAEEVVLNEDRDWDLHNANMLEKLLHGFYMHKMWTEISRVYQTLLAKPPTNPNLSKSKSVICFIYRDTLLNIMHCLVPGSTRWISLRSF